MENSFTGFGDISLPHIRYIGGSISKPDKTGYYMGGEPEDSHRNLIVGKEYRLSYLWFSPSREEKRRYVWSCRSEALTEHGLRKYVNVDPKNFGTIADLRERRINQIID